MYRVVKTSQAPDDIQSSFEYPLLDLKKEIKDILKTEETKETVIDVPEETEEDRREAEFQRRMDEMMAQSEKVLEEARSVAEKIKQDAYEEGFEAGKSQAMTAAFRKGKCKGLQSTRKR